MRHLACLLLLLPPLVAQAAPGDLVVGAADSLIDGRLLRVDARGHVHTLVRLPGTFPLSLLMAADNERILCATGTAPYALLACTPTGAVASLLGLDGPVQQLAPLGGGRFLAAVGDRRTALVSLEPSRRLATTLARPAGVTTAVAVRPEAAEALLGRRWPTPALLRLDLHRGGLTTVVPSLPAAPVALAADPLTGGYLAGLAGPKGAVLAVHPGGRVQTLFAAPYLRGFRLAPDGSLWVLDTRVPFVTVARRDRRGRVLTTRRLFVLLLTTAVEVYASRPLEVYRAPDVRGSFRLEIHAPGLAGRSYRLLAALSPRPPVPLAQGALLHLAPDPLFFLTLFTPPPFLLGAQGVLDARGRARAFLLPPPGLHGLRVFLAGLVLDPARPGGVGQVLNTVSVYCE